MISLPYRSRLAIYADMLRAIAEEGNACPTRVLQRANLSWDRLNRYLSDLKERDLIEEISKGDSKVYQVTEKGRRFLREFDRMRRILEAFGFNVI